MNDNCFDLVIIGGGVAATHTLLALLDAAPEQRFRIALVEPSADLWRGLPYGRRSSINSLIITDLDEFTPPFEHEDFIAFLNENRRRLCASLREEGGAAGAAWVARHAADIEAGAWGALYIPRRFYGDFLSRKVEAQLARSPASMEVFAARASKITRRQDGFQIDLEGGEARSLRGARLLLAVGSPPVQRLTDARADAPALVVEDLYQPSLDDNLAALAAAFERLPPQRRRLLVLGSNATALELAYMLHHTPALRRLLARVTVLSGGGRWPERIVAAPADAVATPALDALDARPGLTAAAIFAASRADIAALVSAHGAQGCDFTRVSERLVQILAQADEAEVRRFHHDHGMDFTRLIRRAGGEYRDAAQALVDDGKMELRAGRLKALTFEADGCAPDAVDGQGAALDLGAPFAAVVNCSGFEKLAAVSAPLLADLLAQGLVRSNPTGRGFEIDAAFRAGENIFVAGPLLAGVFTEAVRYWHVENVRRIADLAPKIAAAILRDIEA